MARSSGTRRRAQAPGLLVWLVGAVLLSPSAAAADLNSKWRFDWGPVDITDVTQVGSAVSFVLTVQSFSGGFDGTLSGSNLQVTDPPEPGYCGAVIAAVVSTDETSLSGTLSSADPQCSDPFSVPITAQRCGCFDGNGTNGDGCDAQCQIETCYTCSGDPSVCAPVSDGTPCDDGSPCTTGETCSSATCEGGSPVTPCVDLSGAWLLHYSFQSVPLELDSHAVFSQTNIILELGGLRGTIDPATGGFSLVEVVPQECAADRFTGQAAADGRSLAGVYTEYVMSPTMCYGFDAIVTGTRCGGGTLDPGEECDDGNTMAGDGCDASCGVEACFGCAGSPSECSPLADGTSCDDEEECTVADACHSGTCTGSPQPDGSACSDDQICTLDDTCASGVCTGTPLDCGPCGTCAGTSPTCTPRMDGATCDDGNGCTVGDSCQAGTCIPGGPMFCQPCFTCVGGSQCVVAPRAGCLISTSPSKTTLFVQNGSATEDDLVTWKWRRGEATALADLGDPTQSTAYALCIYDESAATPTLLFSAVAQQAACPDLACWTARKRGFSYRSTTGDGLSKVELRARGHGRSHVLVEADGPFLVPPPYNLQTPLPLPLRVQLHALDFTAAAPTCFEAEYSGAGVSVNDDGVFRAGATGP